MNVLEFSALVAGGSMLAGFLGALTGLGGGVVVVPMLALLFHVDIRYAIGASLVSVIATSSGAAAAYVREGLLQHPHRHVSGDGNHRRRDCRSRNCLACVRQRDRDRLWSCAAVFGFSVEP